MQDNVALGFSKRIQTFLKKTSPATPCLVLDVKQVAAKYTALKKSLPGVSVFYAIKANPAPAILARLTKLGSSFDCASLNEIDMALAAGCPARRISFGNTIKKEADIAAAYARGIRIFVFDSAMELKKLALHAPGSKVFCRLLAGGEGADWPLSRKFGCSPTMAEDLMLRAKTLGLKPWGLSFHVGSQQRDPQQWDPTIKVVAQLFRNLKRKGVLLDMINIGGGFPAHYHAGIPDLPAYGKAITASLKRNFGKNMPKTIIAEPGRGLVGDAGVVISDVVLVARKDDSEAVRWVYLDIGKFGGLIETMGEVIKYPLTTSKDAPGKPTARVILAGPTCDSADVLYERTSLYMPEDLSAGDKVVFHNAGAYTTTYAAQSFNGFLPLDEHYI